MNWLVIMNVQIGFFTHARTPVRSACTRKPVTSGQVLWSNRRTITRPAERAASAATAPGSAGSVSGPLEATAGSLLFVLVRVSGAAARKPTATAAAATAATVPTTREPIASTTPTAMTSRVIVGADQ